MVAMGAPSPAVSVPLSALCTANEVAAVAEAGSRAESFVIVNGSDRWHSPSSLCAYLALACEGKIISQGAHRPTTWQHRF